MIKVQVLGLRCANCDRMYANAQQAVRESGVDCEVSRIRDIFKILEIGPFGLPALVIDSQIQSSGQVLSVAAIKELLARVKDEEFICHTAITNDDYQ